MSKIETTDIRSTVIGTVRNLKKKRPNTFEETPGTNKASTGSSLPQVGQGNSEIPSTSEATQPNIKLPARTPQKFQPYDKQPKKRRFDDINLTTGRTESEATPSAEENRTKVFDRLAARNPAQTLKARAKKEKDQPINFFNAQFHQATRNLLNIVVDKGNKIKEFIKEKDSSLESVTGDLFADQHFVICFKGLLMEMQKTGEITKELKFITKQTMIKIEEFVIEKLESKWKLTIMDDIIKKHTKQVQRLSQSRIATLKGMLSHSASAIFFKTTTEDIQ